MSQIIRGSLSSPPRPSGPPPPHLFLDTPIVCVRLYDIIIIFIDIILHLARLGTSSLSIRSQLQSCMGICGFFYIFILRKNAKFAFSFKWTWFGLGHFNRPASKVGFFYSEIALEAGSNFMNTLWYRNPQMPSSAQFDDLFLSGVYYYSTPVAACSAPSRSTARSLGARRRTRSSSGTTTSASWGTPTTTLSQPRWRSWGEQHCPGGSICILITFANKYIQFNSILYFNSHRAIQFVLFFKSSMSLIFYSKINMFSFDYSWCRLC